MRSSGSRAIVLARTSTRPFGRRLSACKNHRNLPSADRAAAFICSARPFPSAEILRVIASWSTPSRFGADSSGKAKMTSLRGGRAIRSGNKSCQARSWGPTGIMTERIADSPLGWTLFSSSPRLPTEFHLIVIFVQMQSGRATYDDRISRPLRQSYRCPVAVGIYTPRTMGISLPGYIPCNLFALHDEPGITREARLARYASKLNYVGSDILR